MADDEALSRLPLVDWAGVAGARLTGTTEPLVQASLRHGDPDVVPDQPSLLATLRVGFPSSSGLLPGRRAPAAADVHRCVRDEDRPAHSLRVPPRGPPHPRF